MTKLIRPPKTQGLYDARYEKDNCGIGFIAHLKAQNSRKIVADALKMLSRMDHRGGLGCEKNTGDGAGILTNLPQKFFQTEIKKLFALELEAHSFAVANVFLPQDKAQQIICEKRVEECIREQGLNFIGWRLVPISLSKANIGKTAKHSKPTIKQLIVSIARNMDVATFERALYVVRKYVSHQIRSDENLSQALLFYICSLSSKIICYKGMLIGSQLLDFYDDLSSDNYRAYLAMIHSRFSTNTFPSWDRAQPCRYACHNGEINTREGNFNWMRAREGVLKSTLFNDEDLAKLLPVIEMEGSDSASFDNVLEFLMLNGRSLPEAVAMMIPEAWQNNVTMIDAKKAFYEYHAHLMEPWDGPASIIVTDGHYIGAVLDRNGLRPSRFYITSDERVIMASEVGVVDIPSDKVTHKGRLRPGRMFLVDFSAGKLIDDNTVKKQFSEAKPYRKWLNEQQIHLSEIKSDKDEHGFNPKTLIERMRTFGYTIETMQFMLLPLTRELRDPLGSMGNDTPLACLSSHEKIIYDYFKQLFAQVTNPAIDSIREEIVMSLKCAIGPESNLLKPEAKSAHRLILNHPILTNEETSALKHCHYRGLKTKVIDITYDAHQNSHIKSLLDDICTQSSKAIKEGYSFILLSDRKIAKNRIALSSLLASGAVHHSLVKRHERTKVGLILESGEAREVHHFCLLIGFGVDAINPYLAFEALWQARRDGFIDVINDREVVSNYRKGVAKGMLKVMAKMGISTLQSYKGAQIFEAVGLAQEVVDKCFYGVSSRIKGVSFDVLQQESEIRHNKAYTKKTLDNTGNFHWRSRGEIHMWNPQTIASLQESARENNPKTYAKFVKYVNEQSSRAATLRDLITFKKTKAIPIDEVEPAREILKRFSTGAMSFGALSAESHKTLALAMNSIGAKSNSGEGGEDAIRWQEKNPKRSSRSAIKQVASGRFGVTIEYLNNADELQIKISQGAKPGEGGELPGKKVDREIARVRHSMPGVGLISPPPHHDIYSIEDLAQLIFDLKHANPEARISVKLVAEIGIGTVAAGVTKAKADHIVISGQDGGTGASPLTSIKHAGLPWELGVAETHQTLVMNNLRSRVVLQTDGQMKTGRDVAIAALLGAEEFGFSTAPLITLGCIMMRKCHLNTCPVGIATQDSALRKKFSGKPEYVVNYLFMVAEELRTIMAQLGFCNLNKMIGRADMLNMRDVKKHWKQSHIDLSALLTPAKKIYDNTGVYCYEKQNHNLEAHIDNNLIDLASRAIWKKEAVYIKKSIANTDRAVGTMLSSKLVNVVHDSQKLPDDLIHIKFSGSAGQTLGGFLAKGITLEVEGDANDYVAKGLSGGKVIIYPPKNSRFDTANEIIAGNVCGYGATSGSLYLAGRVAERFCVRNSGANAVVEGVGDHGCEYMTGGRVVILGDIGRNFGAGMSGGIAYIYAPKNDISKKCNLATIDLDLMDKEAQIELKNLINQHARYTHSNIAKSILENWKEDLNYFIKAIPKEYKRVLKSSALEAKIV